MRHLPWYRQLQINLLAAVYAGIYFCDARRWLGQGASFWLGVLGASGVVAALVLSAPWWLIAGLAAVWGMGRFVFERARRSRYSYFVADETAVSPPTGAAPLPADARVRLRATGVFALSSREMSLLLRPADYWRTPLGEHAIMAETNGSFLYQFFSAEMVQAVQAGWLLFARQPRRALAVTFCNRWGPEYNDETLRYYVRNGGAETPCRQRTVYLTFTNAQELASVWCSLCPD